MPKADKIPLVSVYMITYNHEPYIAQALDSVLEQQTNFDYEIVIGEDCSTDNTREIILQYQEKYPGKITLITSETNVGPQQNSVRTLKACRGKYIATLEGDDFWIDPKKLQIQVNFLETNHGCSLCYTDRYQIDKYGNKKGGNGFFPFSKEIEFPSKNEILGKFTPPTQTIMFRKKHVTQSLLNALRDSYNGDTTLSYFLARGGPFGYIDEITACYRQYSGGVYSKIENIKRLEKTLVNYREIKKYFTEKDQVLLNRGNSAILMRLYKEYFYKRKVLNFLKISGLLILNDFRNAQLNFIQANYWLLKGKR